MSSTREGGKSSSRSKLSEADLDKFTKEAESKLSEKSVIKSLEKQFPDFHQSPEVREKIKQRFITDAARKASGGTDGGSSRRSGRSKSEGSVKSDPSTKSSKLPSSSRKSSKGTDKGYIPEEESLRHIAAGKKKRQTGIPLSQRGSVRLEGGWSPEGSITTSKGADGKEYSMTVRSVNSDTYPDTLGFPAHLETQRSGYYSSPTTSSMPWSDPAMPTSHQGHGLSGISPLDADLYSSHDTMNSQQTGYSTGFGYQNFQPSLYSQQSPDVSNSLWGASNAGLGYSLPGSDASMLGMSNDGYSLPGDNRFLTSDAGLGRPYDFNSQRGGYDSAAGNYWDNSHGMGSNALGLSAVG